MYAEMRLGPMAQLTLLPHDNIRLKREWFVEVFERSPFGKCGKTMVEQNRAMRRAGFYVSGFHFLPRDAAGRYFDFYFTLTPTSVHRSHHH